jgi:hypothetical protein
MKHSKKFCILGRSERRECLLKHVTEGKIEAKDKFNFSLLLFTLILIFSSVSLVSLCKYLFRLVKVKVIL